MMPLMIHPQKKRELQPWLVKKSVCSSTQIRRFTRVPASPDAQKPKNEHGRIPTNVKEGTSCHWCRLSCFHIVFEPSNYQTQMFFPYMFVRSLATRTIKNQPATANNRLFKYLFVANMIEIYRNHNNAESISCSLYVYSIYHTMNISLIKLIYIYIYLLYMCNYIYLQPCCCEVG